MMTDIKILGIETSCDETAAAIVKNGQEIISNVVQSQISLHQKFGGVVPEVASRKHIETISAVVKEAFAQAGLRYEDIAAVAVTNQPGLIGALLVGLNFAKGLAYALDKPLIAVNHLHGHIYANFLEHPEIEFPCICLVVSGGHTSLLHIPSHHEYRIIGETRDDAAGEAFDKVARFLGLAYPGGPSIEKAARDGVPGLYKLPRIFLDRQDFEFSFSGLKTAVMNQWRKLEKTGQANVNDMAAEFQQALTEVLVEKTIRAAEKYGVKTVLMAGGVAANMQLRTKLQEKAADCQLMVRYPSLSLCTDNAAMIAGRGYIQYISQDFASLDINAYPGLLSL
ncbi:MAG: tRNA (adenosine(37)-N6)-threonylcarbamoyltransferase complex transferase subunit TsaD [Syntrophomonadaceae bacterium]|jgi:N6-L-threonylcarbamoyladenine synthase